MKLGRMAKIEDTELGRRIERALEVAGYNRHSAARKLGVAYTTITAWVDGSSQPNASNIAKLSEETGFSATWIVRGIGPEMIQPPVELVTDDPAAVEAYLASELGKGVSPDVATRLRQAQFSSLGMASPSLRDVHSVRELIELAAMRRASSSDGDKT